MLLLQKALNGIVGLLFYPFEGLGALWLLVWMSLLTAVVVLLVYRVFSSPKALQEAKDRLKAHILEIRLFGDDPVLTARAFRRVLASNLRYLSLNLKPFLVLLVPILLILIQLEARLGYRPLQPGESTVVHTFWNSMPGTGNHPSHPRLVGLGGVRVQTPPLRIPETREMDWRIAAGPGREAGVLIRYDGHSISLPVHVAHRVIPISTRSVPEGSLEWILYPTGNPLPADGNLAAVQIDYPRRNLRFAGHRIHWIWPYLCLSLAAGYLLKGRFGVTF